MPANIVPAVIGVAVLVTIATVLDWLIAHPVVPAVILAGIGGAFYWWRQRRSRW